MYLFLFAFLNRIKSCNCFLYEVDKVSTSMIMCMYLCIVFMNVNCYVWNLKTLFKHFQSFVLFKVTFVVKELFRQLVNVIFAAEILFYQLSTVVELTLWLVVNKCSGMGMGCVLAGCFFCIRERTKHYFVTM